MTMVIIPLSRIAPADVEALLDSAFGHDRHQRTAYRVRAGTDALPDLSFAATNGSDLLGTLQSWPILLDNVPLILVGPVAVRPDLQRGGIGRALMAHLLCRAPTEPMVMIGDAEYYGRFFGFSAELTARWDAPGAFDRHRLLARNAAGLSRVGMLGPRTFATEARST